VTLKKLVIPDSGSEDKIYGVDYNALIDEFVVVQGKAHENTNDPSSDQKSALAGTSGTPSETNKYVTDGDSRNSDARTPTTHNQNASTINAGSLDGDRLPALSQTKKGGVPATGTPSGKFLKDDDTWATPEGGDGGDMAKTVYDTDDDGVVDNAEKLEGSTKAEVQDHVPQAHTLASHSTKSHSELTDVGTNTHTQIDTHLASAHFGYALSVQALTSSPVDAQTIYFGQLPKAPIATANVSKVYIRKAGTIKIANIYCYSGTAGTAESWSLYIRKNNTSDTLIATLAVSASERVFSNTSLSIAMAADDYFEIKSVNPTWSTNPLTCIFGGYVYIE